MPSDSKHRRAERLLWRLALAAWVSSAISSPWTGWRPVAVELYAAQAVVWVVLWPPVALLLAVRRRTRSRSLARTARALWRRVDGWGRLRRAGVAAVAIAGILATFAGWKRHLGRLVPFYADRYLAEISAAIDGGRPAATLLAPLFHAPAAIRALEIWYFLGWALAGGLALSVVLWAPVGRVRTRILLTVASAWLVLGVGLAYLLASAGPWAWPAVVGGADPYAGDLGIPAVVSRTIQTRLWAHYSAGAPFVAGGISAFPSMHVAIAGTLVLVARAYGGRGARAAAWAAVALTLVGSVVTGMHYAVDGYAALLGVAVLWRATGRVVPARRRGVAGLRIRPGRGAAPVASRAGRLRSLPSGTRGDGSVTHARGR